MFANSADPDESARTSQSGSYEPYFQALHYNFQSECENVYRGERRFGDNVSNVEDSTFDGYRAVFKVLLAILIIPVCVLKLSNSLLDTDAASKNIHCCYSG